MKICFTCSGGGHLEQLVTLASELKFNDCYFLTYRDDVTKSLSNDWKIRFIKDPERNLISTIINFYKSLRFFLKDKPDLVITTGAGVSLPMLIISKFFFRKVIFLEDVYKINKFSLFGKFASLFANLVIVQWANLKNVYYSILTIYL